MAQRWLTPAELEEVIRYELLAVARDIRQGHMAATQKSPQPEKEAVCVIELTIPMTIDTEHKAPRVAYDEEAANAEVIEDFDKNWPKAPETGGFPGATGPGFGKGYFPEVGNQFDWKVTAVPNEPGHKTDWENLPEVDEDGG